MKDYFVTETDEQVEIGDVLHLTLFKDIEGGKVTVEKDVEFNEHTLDWMIKMHFVEEREIPNEEVKDDNDLINFCEYEENIDEIITAQERLERRIDDIAGYLQKVEENVYKIYGRISILEGRINDSKPKREPSNKK